MRLEVSYLENKTSCVENKTQPARYGPEKKGILLKLLLKIIRKKKSEKKPTIKDISMVIIQKEE